MKKRQITIHDIAKELNITASTVSRALNNHPRISDKTKKRVKETATRLNYKPNTIAANLRKGRGNTIGIVIPVINRFFFANIIHGIEQIMGAAGYNIIICSSNENLEKEIRNIHTLITNRVSGILISISSETRNADHFIEVFRSNIPIVQFDRVLKNIDTSMVINDDYQGAYNTVNHLIQQGYKNIAHFAGPRYLTNYLNRINGYSDALRDNNIPFRKEYIFEGVISRKRGSETMNKILSAENNIDAIFAASDMSALGALLELKEQGIQIPNDFGIAGYVNEPFTEFLDPSLTSTEQFGEEIGKISAKELLDHINNPRNSKSQLISITPKLIIRKSSSRKK